MSVEQRCGTWAGLVRHQLRGEPPCDACASADGPQSSTDQAASKPKCFVLMGDSITEQQSGRTIREMDFRPKNDALIIEI